MHVKCEDMSSSLAVLPAMPPTLFPATADRRPFLIGQHGKFDLCFWLAIHNCESASGENPKRCWQTWCKVGHRYAGNDRNVFWRIWNLEDTARTMRILSYLVILATFVKLTDSPWRSQEVLHRSVKVQWIHPFIHARKTRKSRNPFIKQSETCEALARPASLLRTRTCTTSPTSTCSSSTKLQLHTCVDTSRCQSQSFWFGTTDVL